MIQALKVIGEFWLAMIFSLFVFAFLIEVAKLPFRLIRRLRNTSATRRS